MPPPEERAAITPCHAENAATMKGSPRGGWYGIRSARQVRPAPDPPLPLCGGAASPVNSFCHLFSFGPLRFGKLGRQHRPRRRLASCVSPRASADLDAPPRPGLAPALLDLLLRLAHRGGLRPGVDRAGNGVVIDLPLPAGEALRHGDTLVLRLVGEHRPFDDVTDGINPRNGRFPTFADNDSP